MAQRLSHFELEGSPQRDRADHTSATPIFGGKTWSSKLADFEAILGLVFASFITLMVEIGVPVWVLQLMIYSRPPLERWWWGVLAPIGLAVMYLQWKTLQTVASPLEQAIEPRPVALALMQRRWPRGIRPLVAIWWWTQCAVLLYAGHEMASDYGFVHPGTFQRVFEATLQVSVLFMAAYASTIAILIGLAAFSPRPETLLMVWRMRFAIDICIALVGYWLGTRHLLTSGRG